MTHTDRIRRMKSPVAFTIGIVTVLVLAGFIFYFYGLPMLNDLSVGCHYGGGNKSFGCSTSFGTFPSKENIDPRFKPPIYTTDGVVRVDLERLVAHELGHIVTGAQDDGRGRMNNINQNGDPIMNRLGEPSRTSYGGAW